MNKTLLLRVSVIFISILIHMMVFMLSFSVEEPEEITKLIPIFQMIDAVLVEEPVEVILPPPPEPEIISEVNEAVIPDETAEETPPEVELPKPEPVKSTEGKPDKSNDSRIHRTETNYIPFYKVEKRPEFIYQAELEYPLQAKRNRIEGTVIVEADIDEEGILQQVKIVKSAGFGFDEAASAMLDKSTFSPAVMDGRNVGVRMRFTIEFEI
ncbi:MAG: TonB family protein [Spirochaetales bacterium]|nr:TonB family protein [Spirochaetales bacterium]